MLTGFVDLGDIDNHLSEYERILSDGKHKSRALAKTIVVFMVRGALTDIVFPYAVFPVKTLKGHNLFPLFWEAVEWLTRHEFRILAVTCDGASCNRKLFQMHDPKGKLVYKTVNVYSSDSDPIFFISDPPHLLKTLRNCLANAKRHLWVSSFYVHALPIGIHTHTHWNTYTYMYLHIGIHTCTVPRKGSKLESHCCSVPA